MTPVPLRKNRDFVLLQSGQVLSTIGSESTAIAYPLLVLAITHSPAKAGIVGFARVVPWAVDALEYLDRRTDGGAAGSCPLPELFHAVRVKFPALTLPGFHDGLKRLHDVRAVRLTPGSGGALTEPEYAVVVGGQLMYAAGR